MTETKPEKRQSARPLIYEDRATRKARLVRPSVVDRGARLGEPTRRAARARRVVAIAEARHARDLEIGSATRAAERARRAGTMPHKPSGKHQEKLAKRREARSTPLTA